MGFFKKTGGDETSASDKGKAPEPERKAKEPMSETSNSKETSPETVDADVSMEGGEDEEVQASGTAATTPADELCDLIVEGDKGETEV